MKYIKRIVLLAGVDFMLLCMLLFGNYKVMQESSIIETRSSLTAEDQETEYKGRIALTFDDGPHPYYTEQLLDGLKERGVKATFFVMGKQAEEYPDIIKRMAEEGHLIGNHTYTHLQLCRTNEEAFKKELDRTNQLIFELTGNNTEFVRPPFGAWNKKFEEELNMFPVMWSVDPLDWCSTDASGIVNRVVRKIKEDDIILMHDQYKSSVTAALEIIDELKGQGFEFVTVEEILFH